MISACFQQIPDPTLGFNLKSPGFGLKVHYGCSLCPQFWPTPPKVSAWFQILAPEDNQFLVFNPHIQTALSPHSIFISIDQFQSGFGHQPQVQSFSAFIPSFQSGFSLLPPVSSQYRSSVSGFCLVLVLSQVSLIGPGFGIQPPGSARFLLLDYLNPCVQPDLPFCPTYSSVYILHVQPDFSLQSTRTAKFQPFTSWV